MLKTKLLPLLFLILSFRTYAGSLDVPMLVYNGLGTCSECIDWTLDAFKSLTKVPSLVTLANAEIIRDTKWLEGTKILIIPGGRAYPYHEELGELGMQNIRNFVAQGNILIGICGGAYFTARYYMFGEHTQFEIEDYPLALFAGETRGPFFEDFNFLENTVRQISPLCEDNKKRPVYHHGGGWFVTPEKYRGVSILAKYNSNIPEKDGLAAMIKINYGKGQVLASFLHFEHKNYWYYWKDYIFEILKTCK